MNVIKIIILPFQNLLYNIHLQCYICETETRDHKHIIRKYS